MFYSTENCSYICFSLFFQTSLTAHHHSPSVNSTAACLPAWSSSNFTPKLTWAAIKRYFKRSWFRRSQGWIENRVAPLSLIVLNSPVLRTVTERSGQEEFILSILYIGQFVRPSVRSSYWWYRLAVFFIQSLAGQYKLSTAGPGKQKLSPGYSSTTSTTLLLLLFAYLEPPSSPPPHLSLHVLKAAAI